MIAAAPANHSSPRTHRLVRGLRYCRLSLHLVQGLASVGLIYPRISPRARARMTQSWSAKLLRILNVTIALNDVHRLQGVENLVVVSNHVSWLDIFAINAAQPARFIAKSEIRQWPIAGWLVEKSGTIFIHRTKRADAARINQVIHQVLAGGDTIAIFPEGTTTYGDELLKFHTALFEPAVASGAAIAPVAIRYRHSDGSITRAASFAGEMSFTESLARIIHQKSLIAELNFAPIISSNTHGGGSISRREIALQAEEAIADMLGVEKPHKRQHFHAGAEPVAQPISA